MPGGQDCSRPCGVRGKRVLLFVQAAAGLTMVATARDGFAAATLVVVAAQLPDLFSARVAAAWMGAQTVLVGSRHTAESLWAALGEADGAALRRRTRLGPPVVDVERFAPRKPERAMAELGALIERLRVGGRGAGDSES